MTAFKSADAAGLRAGLAGERGSSQVRIAPHYIRPMRVKEVMCSVAR